MAARKKHEIGSGAVVLSLPGVGFSFEHWSAAHLDHSGS
jgi:hypothetical protein